MKLIKPSVEILEQGPGLQGIYDMIELCGKTSYKSPVKGGEEAKKFVEARINEGHLAVLEFGTVYLRIDSQGQISNSIWKIWGSPYSKLNYTGGINYLTTNYRVLVERDALDALEYLCEPTEYHIKRYCARFITDRGVSHELVRHRTMSFCQESTRYCNYSKDKFGNELTFIIPSWSGNMREGVFDDAMSLDWYWHSTDGREPMIVNGKETQFLGVFNKAEQCYLEAIKLGCTPQEARQVLPNAIKTEICMCGFEEDWKHFFDLRCAKNAHPDMQVLANQLKDKFEEQGLI